MVLYINIFSLPICAKDIETIEVLFWVSQPGTENCYSLANEFVSPRLNSVSPVIQILFC